MRHRGGVAYTLVACSVLLLRYVIVLGLCETSVVGVTYTVVACSWLLISFFMALGKHEKD